MADTPERFGKYRVLRLLARGGMGEVYLARQEGPAGFSKLVVVKRLLDHVAVDHQFVEMFLNEARLAAHLSHPNVVQIFELGQTEDSYFIAMEYVHGETLAAIRKTLKARQERMPPVIAAHLCAQALMGLHYAHTLTDEAGAPFRIVHRDVTPDNVLVGFGGSVKVVDFGIAKAARRNETNPGTIKGKFAFMSPEQIKGEKVDARGDLFSMGVLLYTLLTGRKPFRGNGFAELATQIVHDEPPPVWQLNPGISAVLGKVLSRAMAKKPDDRFQSAEEMAMALEAYVRARGEVVGVPAVKAFMLGLFGTPGAPEAPQPPREPHKDEKTEITSESEAKARVPRPPPPPPEASLDAGSGEQPRPRGGSGSVPRLKQS